MANDTYEVEVDGRKITVTERPWQFPSDAEVRKRCGIHLNNRKVTVGELYSDFWAKGGGQLPAPDDNAPAVELQVTCEGVCDGATTCALKMVQFAPNGRVISEIYADTQHQHTAKRPTPTVCQPPPPAKATGKKPKGKGKKK